MATQPLPKTKPWYRAKAKLDQYLGLIGKALSSPLEPEAHELAPSPPLVVITPPVNVADLPSIYLPYFDAPFVCPPQIVYRLRQANVAWHGTVVKGLRVFVPSLPYPFLEPEYSGMFLLRQFKARKQADIAELQGPVGLIYDQWAPGNYFHWMAEVLPRLALLKKFQPDCTILLPGPKPSLFMTQTVEAFGFRKTYIMAPGEMLQVSELLVAALPGIRGYIIPSMVLESRNAVLNSWRHAIGLQQKSHRRVYVSRSRQSWRQLTNEAEVVAILTKYNFETVYFEELSFLQQVALMQQTAIFIGIHGANMTNILYMQKNGYVIEMLSETYINISYLHMSNSLDLNYYLVPSTTGSPPEVHPSYADITTDVEQVKHVVRTVCEEYEKRSTTIYN
jgi:hypothetical protein